jgi:hypothetical protein
VRRSAGLLGQNMDPGVWNRLQGTTADAHEALDRLDSAEPRIASLEDTAAGLEGRVTALETVEDWHVVGGAGEPAFQNSWVDNGGALAPTRFRAVRGDTEVQIAVKNGVNATVVFTLPAGYRPSADLWFAGVGSGAYVRWVVYANGDVEINTSTTAPQCLVARFKAEQ